MLSAGVPARTFDAAVRAGELVSVGRGTYVDAAQLKGQPEHQRSGLKYRYRCIAVAASGSRLLSHESAAALHGLAVLHPHRRAVHLTGDDDTGYAKNRLVVVHAGPVAADDVVVIDGVRVTGLARTAVDVALTTDFPRALAVLDSALRQGIDADDLRQRLKAPRKGVGTARRALEHADAGAANPGESWCRAQMIDARFPVPVLQRVYRLNNGRTAEVDFDIDGKVVLEFDGLVKYGGTYLGTGQTPSAVLIAEKLREDGLRELGLDVVRAVWADLQEQTMLPRLARHLAARGVRVPPRWVQAPP
ncbi:hypothetical protein GCM10022231_06990 [Gordonia caeni]|uniref:Type IV toxin-antitoxin system AbiEi family antitoxin domain-containing protein n=1 Tax=Gordonia caeni TaxID=1007097 RepID=A0ABP7NRR2_9ACTN